MKYVINFYKSKVGGVTPEILMSELKLYKTEYIEASGVTWSIDHRFKKPLNKIAKNATTRLYEYLLNQVDTRGFKFKPIHGNSSNVFSSKYEIIIVDNYIELNFKKI